MRSKLAIFSGSAGAATCTGGGGGGVAGGTVAGGAVGGCIPRTAVTITSAIVLNIPIIIAMSGPGPGGGGGGAGGPRRISRNLSIAAKSFAHCSAQVFNVNYDRSRSEGVADQRHKVLRRKTVTTQQYVR